MEWAIARNPDPDSVLPDLLWLPVEGGLVFRTKGTCPRTNGIADLVSSLTSGRLRYQLGELATLARAAVVVARRTSGAHASHTGAAGVGEGARPARFGPRAAEAGDPRRLARRPPGGD